MLSHVQLFCDPMDFSLPGSSIYGILQARILEWVAISSFRRSSNPEIEFASPAISCNGWRILYHWATREAPSIADLLGNKQTKKRHKMKAILKNSKCNLIFFKEKAYKIVPQQCCCCVASMFNRNNFWLLWKHVSPGNLLGEWQEDSCRPHILHTYLHLKSSHLLSKNCLGESYDINNSDFTL